MQHFLSGLLVVALSGLAAARLPDGRLHANFPPRPIAHLTGTPPSDGVVHARTGATIPPYDTTYYFDQLIDHNNPGLGTFQQRYWHTWEFYEPGGPIILMTPGESNADGFDFYLTNATIPGQIAQQQNGATIVLEHRFYGYSNPFSDLSVASLRYHTIQQAIDDLEYFADNVELPMPGGDAVGPDQAPWIMVGGSYAGALTSWTMVDKPGLFWAGYSSSAVAESIVDFWAYFEPIRQFMPQNCSVDVQAVIAHVDLVFTTGTPSEINALKAQFGMSNVPHLEDVAGALRNNLWDWQKLQPYTGPGAAFFRFCDALEVKNGVNAPATGWGLDHALSAWGSYFRNTYYSLVCGDSDPAACFGTHDTSQSYWTDDTVGNDDRSWRWIVCNEVGFFQDSAPVNRPTLVSRLVQPIGDERQCVQMFPGAFNSPSVPKADQTNAAYGGWNATVDRLFSVNGQRDPWRDATVSAEDATTVSTVNQPVALGDGFHCSDLLTASAYYDATIARVQSQALASMKAWLEDWQPGGVERQSAKWSPTRRRE
ncbi:hypothetical protein EW146_g10013 [Bondarzewia mesenterica]|uniref:Peptidase S28 n=1 Tax=Bondarzewia mesenterica TaxID=1095465 RepID=A0A4S4L2K5_9AGAM|nr:hypothetical protein EW146_g10013 [Bondarzewia mesenterica]